MSDKTHHEFVHFRRQDAGASWRLSKKKEKTGDYMDYFEKVKQYGITPVIKIPTVEHAVPLAKCLKNAGIPLIEVTMRNECALDGIRAIRAEVPDMLISAGTVLSAKQAQDAVDAGVDAIVTPGLNREVVEY